MTISLPDTLTIENSGKYILSIRLLPDGLSFAGYIPAVPGSFFYRKARFDSGISVLASFKEFFFAHDFLTWPYKQVRFQVVTPQYTLVPTSIFEEKRKEEFLSFQFSQPENHCLTNPLPDAQTVLLFGIDREVYEFCVRSFIDPLFIHYITPQLLLWKRQSLLSFPRRMYGIIQDKTVDIFCYNRGELLFANTFAVKCTEDILYFLLYVWRQLEFDQQKDMLYLSGDKGDYHSLQKDLHTYLREIHPVEMPSEAYLLGTEMAQVPIDLMASICEL